MAGQQLIVCLLVLKATAYLLWQTGRTWFGGKGGCGGGCSCPGKKAGAKSNAAGSTTTLISVNELTQRLRGRS